MLRQVEQVTKTNYVPYDTDGHEKFIGYLFLTVCYNIKKIYRTNIVPLLECV